MKEFDFHDEAVLVAGSGIDDFLATLGPYKARGQAIACRHLGIDELSSEPGTYYSFLGYLGLLKEMQEQFGRGFLRRLGRLTGTHARLPPEANSAEVVFSAMTAVLYANFKNGEGKLGAYAWTKTDDGGLLVCDTPYPCSLSHGVLEGFALRFHPHAVVEHIEDQPCRHDGGTTCTYRVLWRPDPAEGGAR